jgi:hypothetical protein
MLAAAAQAEGLGRGDGDPPTGLDHPAARDQPLALGGGEEVDLVLGGQHVGAGRHQAVGGVAAGAVEHGADQGAVEEALLLGEARIGRRLEDAAPWCHLDQLDPERPHKALPREARPQDGGEIRVLRLEWGHRRSLCGARGVDRDALVRQSITAAGRPCQRCQEGERRVR